MHTQDELQQQNYPTYSFNQRPQYSRFLYFLGMGVFSVIAVGIMSAISSKYNPIADNNTVEPEQKITKPSPQPQPVIVVPPVAAGEVPQPQQNDNPLGLSLEEYSNLSNPSEEMLNCLIHEGGKGCFEDEYTPNFPVSESLPSGEIYYQQPRPYSSANHRQGVAIRVIDGQPLLNWRPSSLPAIPHGVCHPFYRVQYGERFYCGRRLIAQPQQP